MMFLRLLFSRYAQLIEKSQQKFLRYVSFSLGFSSENVFNLLKGHTTDSNIFYCGPYHFLIYNFGQNYNAKYSIDSTF